MTKAILTLDLANIIYTVECLPEDMPVRDNVQASGDAALDREAEEDILRDLEAGNPWAWCTVKVTAKLGAYQGDDYLGGCSYKSEEEFRTESVYFEDMKETARRDLVGRLEAAGAVFE